MTPAEELVLIDAALVRIYEAAAQSVTKGDRSLAFLQIDKLIARKKELEEVADTADDASGGIALVEYREHL